MPDLDDSLARALDLGDLQDWTGMAELLKETLEAHPREPEVLCWLGVAEQELGLDGAAYERFQQCVAAAPEDAHVLATAGAGLARFDDPEAESTLRAAAFIAPDLAFARCMYGAYLAREGLSTEALLELDEAVALAPEDPDVLVERGVALALAGRLGEAVESFQSAWEADPGGGWARLLGGLVELESDRPQDALVHLVAACDMRPEDLEAHVMAALCAAVVGDEDRAYELVERARMAVATEGSELVDEAADRIEAGADAARAHLIDTILPGALRERLMIRP